ncbi:hypothetical protein MMC32_007308 [Xylographa parallela]|nr:hypothetical protein [Xylographa parallela]
MRSLRLGPYSMLPPSCATTELSEMHYYYEDFLEAMEPFWGITPLQVTLPWDFELQKWQDLMGYVHGAFPNVTEFTIDRPNVDFLLPDALASHETFNLPENSYNTLFWPHCVTNHPLGFEFPANISQILIQTDQDIYFVNEMHVPLGRTAIRLTPESDIIRDIWRNSLDGLLPSPGYNSKTKRLVGGEEKRRMFPHWYPEDPPPEPAPTPSPGLQPYQDFIQPNHFQQS